MTENYFLQPLAEKGEGLYLQQVSLGTSKY